MLAMAGGLTNSSRTAVAGPRAETMHSQTRSFELRVRFGARPPPKETARDPEDHASEEYTAMLCGAEPVSRLH